MFGCGQFLGGARYIITHHVQGPNSSESSLEKYARLLDFLIGLLAHVLAEQTHPSRNIAQPRSDLCELDRIFSNGVGIELVGFFRGSIYRLSLRAEHRSLAGIGNRTVGDRTVGDRTVGNLTVGNLTVGDRTRSAGLVASSTTGFLK